MEHLKKHIQEIMHMTIIIKGRESYINKRRSSMPILLTLVMILISFCWASHVNAAEINWGNIETKTVTAFYPGVASWDFMKDKNHGTGAAPVKTTKKTCAACHISKTGEFDINADKIISGELNMAASKKPLEPKPIPGMSGFKEVKLQAAYDAKNIYLRFQWTSAGSSVSDPSLLKDELMDRISIQISDKIKTFRNYGCFITCHSNQTGMPENRGSEINLYGYYSRSKGKLKPQETLDGYLAKGQFIDLWIASFVGNKIIVSDQYILSDRVEDQNDLQATGNFKDGQYTLLISRKLSTADPKDIEFKDGGAFSIGIAIHDNQNKGRKHYTSFPVSIGLSSPADINAQKF